MESYVTKILIDNKWRDVLIYKSAEPMIFTDMSIHKKTVKTDNETEIVVYIAEPYIYKTVEPTAEDNYYYYWFLIKSTETETIVTHEEEVESLNTQVTDLQLALCDVYEMMEV